MPQMSNSQARVIDPILTTVAQGYSNNEFVGETLFPTVKVGQRSGKIIQFGKEAFMLYATGRSPGQDTKRISFGYAGAPYAVEQHALEGVLPIETMQEANAAWSNLSPSTTKQVIGFADAAGANKVLDTGLQLACPWPAKKLRGKRWTPALAASAYAFGGGSHGRAWFTNTLVRRLEIRLNDPANLQGYIEVARLYVGECWSPAVGADYNPSLTPGGTSTAFRDGSGARRSTRGTKFNSMSLALSNFEEVDRASFWEMATGNSIDGPLIAALYPNHPQKTLERDHQMYCAFASPSGVRRPNSRYHAATLELESI